MRLPAINVDYLGYEISAQGARSGGKKIQSVLNFPRPENIHSVRQSLGLASYFRKIVQNFAQITLPLSQLLKKAIARREEEYSVAMGSGTKIFISGVETETDRETNFSHL